MQIIQLEHGKKTKLKRVVLIRCGSCAFIWREPKLITTESKIAQKLPYFTLSVCVKIIVGFYIKKKKKPATDYLCLSVDIDRDRD